MELMQASEQWATRPADERFTSLYALGAKMNHLRSISRGAVVSSRSVEVIADGHKGLSVVGKAGVAYHPTHWSFGQLCQRVGAPASYLRDLPAPLSADCLNYGLRVFRDAEDIGLLLRANGTNELAAVTGPNYGRVWNSEVADALISNFGDGVSGQWRVPGEFGKRVDVSAGNTTLYASDRDMFVFLADEDHRITLPNRRDGQSGSLARGFFIWNSEVGSSTLGIAMFLFDYACSNRIVWGATDFKEVKIRHTVSAPDKFISEIQPILSTYANAPASPVETTLRLAQEKRIADKADALETFLASRKYTKAEINGAKAAHLAEEGRPIETLWDAVTGLTAYAKNIQWQDDRVTLERKAGSLLELVHT